MNDENDNKNLKILYENMIKLSESQDNRKNNIDNKVNIIITIMLVLLGIIIEFIDINKIIIANLIHILGRI